MELEELGIIKVRIPLPFRLNHVNCYLAKGEDGWMIIDAGLGYPATREAWESSFTENRLQPKDIRKIYLTHFHSDHYGFLGALQRWTGAKVYMSEQSIEQIGINWTEPWYQQMPHDLICYGVPPELAEKTVEHSRRLADWVVPHAKADFLIQEGQKFRFGALTYEAIHTPGHAAGQMSLLNEKEKVLIAGDHILEKITANVSYRFDGNEHSLQEYLDALNRVKTLGVETVIPGHGSVFTNCSKRIDEILNHHESRLSRILDILGDCRDSIPGSKTAYQVCRELFNREITESEIRAALGETISHLQYLANQATVNKQEKNGCLLFSVC